MKFDLFQRPSHLRAGVRYERTKIDSSALVPVPIGTQWVAANEFNLKLWRRQRLHDAQGQISRVAAGDRFRRGADPQRQAARILQPHDHARRLREHAGRPDARLLCSASAAAPAARATRRYCRTSRRTSICRLNGITAGRAICRSAISTRTCRTSFRSTRVDQTAFDLHTPVGGPRYLRRLRRSGRARPRTQIRDYIAANYPEHGRSFAGSHRANP